MKALVAPEDVERFRGAVARRLGLQFDDSKLRSLAEILQQRVDATGFRASQYLERFESPLLPREELTLLAEELTVGETYFFRNTEQFRAFVEVAVPDRLEARSPGGRLAILSAGCASGEEPYSLAMLLRERFAGLSPAASIRGVDINRLVIAKARAGRYSAWALRETPADVQRRWFRAEGREFALDETIRGAVEFEERNLAEDDAEVWFPGAHDIVFCRNVVMYFSPEGARALVARITRTLAPGGYLFLGHAETLRGLSQDFHLCHTHDTFYYRRKTSLRPEAEEPGAARPEPPPLVAPEPLDSAWIDVVQRATDRIRALSEKRAPQPVVAGGPDLGPVTELLRTERYADALAMLRRTAPDTSRDPDVLLLRSALLTHSGRLSEAEAVCNDLLAKDDLNAGAHYLLALCREGAGDRNGAVHHDHAAAYLDAGFAMPRLHLGLMARRARDRDTARRELASALKLLATEDAARLLLFGGGFGRDALTALCRTELAALGGNP